LAFHEKVDRLCEQSPVWFQRALARGSDYADLFFEETTHRRRVLTAKVKRGKIGYESPAGAEYDVTGAGVQVLSGVQRGFVSTQSIAGSNVGDAFAQAVSEAGGRGTSSDALSLTICRTPEPSPQDVLTAREQSALAETAVDTALGLDERIVSVTATYRDRTRRVAIFNTEGSATVFTTINAGFRVEVRLAVGDRQVEADAVAGGGSAASMFFNHPPEIVAQEAVFRARMFADARPLAAGRMPVVLAAGWGGVWLHEVAGHRLEADQAGSFRRGEQMAAIGVTIHDDARLRGARGTAPFDDEGTPTQRTTLVHEGRLVGLLTDRLWARRLHRPCSANARRQDYRCPPLPRMTNLIMDPGPATPEELIAGAQSGLFVTRPGHGLIMPAEDRFSIEVKAGYRIENGHVTHPVQPMHIEGHVSDALQNVRGIGNDFGLDSVCGTCEKYGQLVPISVGMPSIWLNGLIVS